MRGLTPIAFSVATLLGMTPDVRAGQAPQRLSRRITGRVTDAEGRAVSTAVRGSRVMSGARSGRMIAASTYSMAFNILEALTLSVLRRMSILSDSPRSKSVRRG
jgi:hypothetical protein